MKNWVLALPLIFMLAIPTVVFSAPNAAETTETEATNSYPDPLPTWAWLALDGVAWVSCVGNAVAGAVDSIGTALARLAMRAATPLLPHRLRPTSWGVIRVGMNRFDYIAIGSGLAGVGILVYLYLTRWQENDVKVSAIDPQDLHEQFSNLKVARAAWEASQANGQESLGLKSTYLAERLTYHELAYEFFANEELTVGAKAEVLTKLDQELARLDDSIIGLNNEWLALSEEEESAQIALEDRVLGSMDLDAIEAEIASRLAAL